MLVTRLYSYIGYLAVLTVLVLNNLSSDGIVISHLPDGPTAHFKLTSVKLGKAIKVHVEKKNYIIVFCNDGIK